MRTFPAHALTLVVTLCLAEHLLLAQDKPPAIIEAVVGRSGFIEVWDQFTTLRGGARFFATPRVAIGPEATYLTGNADSPETSHLVEFRLGWEPESRVTVMIGVRPR
jgi:hypothetical protein